MIPLLYYIMVESCGKIQATLTRTSAHAMVPALYSDVPSELLQLVVLNVAKPRKLCTVNKWPILM